jgi:blue copper oxidase
VLHVVDGEDEARGLPTTYGTDDLTLVIQDRRFDRAGRMIYDPAMPDVMHGFSGDTILVNGQVGRTAVVPPGIVRLRLVNASNGRIYPLSMASGREMHLVATDAGYLDAPVALRTIALAPGERVEILVDFSGAERDSLVSEDNPNLGMMMRGMMGSGQRSDPGSRFEVLAFPVDGKLEIRVDRLPDALGGTMPDLAGLATMTREISLDMGMMGGGMGGGMMGGGMMGGRGPAGTEAGRDLFAINGQPFDMQRLNFSGSRDAVERWIVTPTMMMHPFHIHGVAFQVLSEGGRPPRPENRGWKDTVLVRDRVELAARFDKPASRETPFMFHCHILEHEDRGMMGQFTVG